MTPGIRRLVTACSLALVASLPLAALHASAQTPTWPTGLPLTRFGQEGDVVSLEFDVTSPDGQPLSFSATGLPLGLQIDSQTGRVHGTLAESDAGTVNTGGSAGIHSNITLTARSSGGQTSTYVFSWQISRFRKGDVFAGIGGGKYNVFSEDGVFKYTLTTETADDFIDHRNLGYGWGGGTTTGCGYNWVTRKMYFTAFDDDYDPAFYEMSTVPVGGVLVRSNPIRTFRDSGLEKGEPASNRPIDGAPESVVFGTDFGPNGVLGGGDDRPAIYIGHAGGYYNENEDLADIDERPTVGSDDGWQTIYYLDASGNFILDGNGQRIPYPQGTSPEGFLEKWAGAFFLDANGDPISGLTRHGRDIQKFVPNGSGGWVRLAPDPSQPLVEGFDTHAGWQGSDWLDLASDQRTMYYTSEWGAIYRYDVGPDPDGPRQLAPFVNMAPMNPNNPAPVTMYALRLLPPGDGSGGVLVATPSDLLRFSGDGRLVKLYDANADGWFALNISPDGRSVWSASTSSGRIYRWDIASGALHDFGGSIGRDGIPSGATPDAFGRYTLDGLCVMGEYTAAQEICGDGEDNDGDGEVDEVCQALEVCSNLSPGDDDGDGLVDSNDPDCPGTVNVCAASGYTDASVAGFCARKNFEGEQVSISPAPPSAGDRDEYTITGLPPGIVAGPTGILSGVPEYTIRRNTDSPNTLEYTVNFDVVRKRISDGVVIATYEQSFVWTIENVNRPPVPFSATQTIRPGQSASFTVAGQTGGAGTDPCAVDPDCEDTVTLTPVSSPGTGTMTVTGTTHTWVAPPTFTGSVTYTYTRSDGHGGTAPVSLTINVVNAPPVAVNDTATTRPGQAVTIAVLGNDSDPDVPPTPGAPDTLTVTSAFTQPSNGTATLNPNGTFTYTSAPGFVGVDTFTYTISDGFGGTATATVTVTVTNRPPVAIDDVAVTRPGVPVGIAVLGNDSDPDGDTVTLTAAFTQGVNGTVTRSGNTFIYTPVSGFVGVDTFTYTISDGFGGTDTATVTITVTNRAPVAIDDAVSTIAGYQSPSFNVLTMGTPDSDPDGDAISITTVTNPSNGTLTRTGNSFVYMPGPGFSGIDTFTYTITDPYGLTDTAVVTITVRNLPPVAVNDSATTAGTRPVTISVLQNDSDPDQHSISVTGATTPANGSVVVNANGSITYTANPGFQGIDTFFYTITDGFGGQSTATVTITVGPPNRFDPCLCSTATASPGEIWPPNHKQTQVVTVTNVADPDGGPLTIKILGIYQDEPTNYLGDGETTIDAGGVGTSTAWVRAERTGNPNVPGNGRVYEIVFEATATDGSTCTGSVFTGVPHDQGQGNVIVDDGIRYDSTVAGGPIVRTALKVENGLTDADVAERGFELKYVGEARIGSTSSGSASTNRELIIGPSIGSTNDTEDFTWSNNQPALFWLWKIGDTVHFKLITSSQYEYVTYNANCANGECDDIFIRAQAGGTGKITLSSMNLNGLGISETLTIPVGGPARSLHLSGMALGDGMSLTGLVKIEWTGTRPVGDTVNFRVQVGSACPTDSGGGGGGGDTPPLARSDSYSTNEDTPLVVETASGILPNDLTFAGPLSAELVSTTSDGTLSLNANGSFTYTPNPNFNGQDTFRYRVSDGSLWSEPALVTITVNPVGDPPVAVDNTATTNEGTPVSIAVLGNDSDPFGGPLSVTALTQPANGAAVVSGAQIVYSPNPGFLGTDTFTYTITGTEGTDTATVTVTVININEPPVAIDNAYTTAEDTPLNVAAPGILGNDTDPDAGDALTAILVTGPERGTLTLNPSGAFVYTPAANYHGTDRFTYRVRDPGGLESNVATVTITITAVNDPPVAVDDSYVVSEDSALQINAPGVKSNDSDPDTAAGDLTISLVTGAQRGSLTLNPNGSFIYTPFPDVTGSDTFTYRISDGTGSDIGVATIAITDAPDPPVAVDDAATTQEDTPVTIAVLGNDSDPDTATLTIQGVTPPVNGVAAIVGTQVRYTPNPGFNGQDAFTYTITDGQATATATVTVTIAAVNDAPVAVNDAYTTPRNTVLNVQTPGIVGNDSDPEGGSLTARIVTPPTSGSVVLQTHGAFSYTPANGFTGVATFTYRVNDGAADSNVATVTITVTATNQPPVAVNDSYSTDKNVPLTIAAPGILSNDSDPDAGNTITALLISGTPGSAGSVALNANGSFTFTPANNYTGTTTFRYRAVDNQSAQSNEAIVTIVVNNVVTSGRVCYDGGSSKTQYRAQIDWERLANGDIRARAAVSRNYADNTYGVNKIGWGNKKRDFKAVYNSDFGQLAFYDANGSKKIDFRIDLLSAMSGTPSGYGTRGASGGDGAMVSGSASNIVSLDTSMNQNMNAFGYVTTAASHPLKSYSPSTNDAYTPNATYPLWIWDMWYEATIKASTFGSAGFGTVSLRALHASPPKVDVSSWRLINCQ